MQNHHAHAFLDRVVIRVVDGGPRSSRIPCQYASRTFICWSGFNLPKYGEPKIGFNEVTIDADGIVVSPFSMLGSRIRLRQISDSTASRSTRIWPSTCHCFPFSCSASYTLSSPSARRRSKTRARSVFTDLAVELTSKTAPFPLPPAPRVSTRMES